ncbi:hypothetical protein B0H10DRAFT_1955896 [Mycena sp. CBHHK59/15]|nr:hypothetical protein B0H10DRAFT_1955896 [Mycena sp. CBHHK59/15]
MGQMCAAVTKVEQVEQNGTQCQTQPCPSQLTAYYQHLESLLDSALATLMIIHNIVSESEPLTYTTCTTNILRVLSRNITATLTVSTPTPTPASTPAPVCPMTTVPITATYAWKHNREQKDNQNIPSDKYRSERTHFRDGVGDAGQRIHTQGPKELGEREAGHKLIAVRIEKAVCEELATPGKRDRTKLYHTITDAIEAGTTTPKENLLLTGIWWTQNRNLTLQLSPDADSVKSIGAHASAIWDAVRPLLGFPEGQAHPQFDWGNPWCSVVFHDVPVCGRPKHKFTPKTVQTWLGTGDFSGTVKAVSVLCQEDDFATKQAISLHVSVLLDTDAEYLVENGGNLFGMRCRVSHYIARPHAAH